MCKEPRSNENFIRILLFRIRVDDFAECLGQSAVPGGADRHSLSMALFIASTDRILASNDVWTFGLILSRCESRIRDQNPYWVLNLELLQLGRQDGSNQSPEA